MRILIGDDHAIVRKGLIDVLSFDFPQAAFVEASSAQQILDFVAGSRWTALILDLKLSPGRSGLDILPDLRKLQPRMPILVLSGYSEDEFALRCLRAGAAGYLTKTAVPEELVKALSKVITGGRYVSHDLAEKIALLTDPEFAQPPHNELSNRELEVLSLMSEGNSTTDIAQRLAVSIKTVSTYRSRILKKLNVSNNAAMIRYALKHRLVD
jgi:two-component system, NarL family, invasion response regulator UvrY